MTLLQALLLGIIQGATEFLPISSSGHLVLVPWLLGWQLDPEVAFAFDVLVQLGTLLAVIGYFRRDLATLLRAALSDLRARRPEAEGTGAGRLLWLLAAATAPGVLAGLTLRPLVEDAFRRPAAVSALLLLTAAMLFLSEWLGRPRHGLESLGFLRALGIGAAQALALFPGVSRSGATIAAGLASGLRRPEAARFSFLMSIPIMLGAGTSAFWDLVRSGDGLAQAPTLAMGFLAAATVGYLSIRWLLGYLSRHPLTAFAWYCTALGLGGLLLGVLRG